MLASKFRQELQIFKLENEGNPTNFFDIIQIESSKITDEKILEKEIFSKIITAAQKMYMNIIRTAKPRKYIDILLRYMI